MAYIAPIGATKLVDAASVNNAASVVAKFPIPASEIKDRPIAFYVNFNQVHDLDFGSCAQSTDTLAELDIDDSYSKTSRPAVSTHGTKKYLVYPDGTGYAVCVLTNKSGSAAGTANIWAVRT